MVVGGSQQGTLDLGFVLLGTRIHSNSACFALILGAMPTLASLRELAIKSPDKQTLCSMFDDTLFLMNSFSRVRNILESLLSTITYSKSSSSSSSSSWSVIQFPDNTSKQDLLFNLKFFHLLNILLIEENDILLKKYRKWFKLSELINIIIHPVMKCKNLYQLRNVYMENLANFCSSIEFKNNFVIQYSESLSLLWRDITEELDKISLNQLSSNDYKIFLRDSIIPCVTKIFANIQLLEHQQPQCHNNLLAIRLSSSFIDYVRSGYLEQSRKYGFAENYRKYEGPDLLSHYDYRSSSRHDAESHGRNANPEPSRARDRESD
ncbi:unnamed protein product [Schistosoma margrebowiei]|uniref:Uncharacterized protein n=1 Tax=Schistosoma margrebowiei TaxID=48269 RepID=A0A183LF59_9TREM|nr:unnamed protein product [Schistosoma margrebowiei]